jgi:mono/diheme cytochrome c family protein
MTRGSVLALACVALVAACQAPRSPSDPAVQAEARQIWQDRCANCHGLQGHGDGPQARHLLVPPRRLSDRAWRAAVSDEHLHTVIVEGGAAVGLDPVMAPNPDLRGKPEVVQALVEHLRRL